MNAKLAEMRDEELLCDEDPPLTDYALSVADELLSACGEMSICPNSEGGIVMERQRGRRTVRAHIKANEGESSYVYCRDMDESEGRIDRPLSVELLTKSLRWVDAEY